MINLKGILILILWKRRKYILFFLVFHAASSAKLKLKYFSNLSIFDYIIVVLFHVE